MIDPSTDAHPARMSGSVARPGFAVVIVRLGVGVALVAVAGVTAVFGLLALCGRAGRVTSPMALCPYAPGTAALFLGVAGVSLGLGIWSLSMTPSRRAAWFVLAGLVVAALAAALS